MTNLNLIEKEVAFNAMDTIIDSSFEINKKTIIKKKNLNENKNIPVDKKMVHKHKNENVLICNLRRALPRKINEYVMENIILPALNEDEKSLITTYYSKSTLSLIGTDNNQISNDYILQSLPNKIKYDSIGNYIDPVRLTYSDKRLLLKYYQRNKNLNKFILSDKIDEETELKILKLFHLKQLHISNDIKTKISDIFERFNDEKFIKKDEFFSNMFVDTNHAFFFEHPNEHVPALMLTEASRQFLIAICHKYLNVPYKGYSFILSGMKLNFLSYLELNFPVTFICKVNVLKKRKNIATFIDMDILVLQRNKLAASINYIGKGISSDVFSTLRQDKTAYIKLPRFNPREKSQYNITLISNNNKEFQCDLIDLSMNGFKLSFKSDSLDIIIKEKNNDLNFYLYFEGIGIINGICSIKWIEKKEDDLIAGIKIKSISQEDANLLNETLKRFCYVVEEREIL